MPVNCPFCSLRVKTPEGIEGKKARCRGCSKTFVFPTRVRRVKRGKRLHPALVPGIILAAVAGIAIGSFAWFLGPKAVEAVKKVQAKQTNKPKSRFWAFVESAACQAARRAQFCRVCTISRN
jgi:hypothetical protein